MKTSRFSEQQIALILKQVDDGLGVEDVCHSQALSRLTRKRLSWGCESIAPSAKTASFGNLLMSTPLQRPSILFARRIQYDKHKGTDLRIRSMADVVSGFPATAVADGTVMRLRDGEPDHLVKTEDDFESVAGKECGNGLVLRLAEDYEIQYCHLRKGSLVVAPGQAVQIGDKLGEVGASGLAQFPHVHITLRKSGKLVDPLTGRSISSGCNREFDNSRSLFSKSVVAKVDPTVPDILSLGLSGQPVRRSSVVEMGPPPKLGANDSLFVAWGWLTRLNKGDRLRIALKNNRAETIIDNTSEPLERNKATYSAYAGKRQRLPKGSYTVTLSVLRRDEFVAHKSKVIVLE